MAETVEERLNQLELRVLELESRESERQKQVLDRIRYGYGDYWQSKKQVLALKLQGINDTLLRTRTGWEENVHFRRYNKAIEYNIPVIMNWYENHHDPSNHQRWLNDRKARLSKQ